MLELDDLSAVRMPACPGPAHSSELSASVVEPLRSRVPPPLRRSIPDYVTDFKDLLRLIQAPYTYPVQKGSPWGFGHADPDLVGRVPSVAAFVPVEKE